MLFDPDVENLEADKYGKFSLCLPLRQISHMNDEEIIEEFSQAGNVVNVHRSETMAFIRFDCKEELQNCFSHFKSTYSLRIGQSRKNKGGASSNDRRNDENTHSGPSTKRRQNQGVNNSEGNRGIKNNRDSMQKSTKFNGTDEDSHSHGDRHWSGKDRNHSGTKDSMEGDSEDSNTDLFASNIESEEGFMQSIQKYNTKSVHVVVKGLKKFAFVEMWSHEDALTVIKDLNYSMQSSRNLCMQFNQRPQDKREKHSSSDNNSLKSDSHSDVSSTSKKTGPNSLPRNKTKENLQNGKVDHGMPPLESEASGMPPLVADKDISDTEGKYDFDCGVLVTHFPAQTLESELRSVFKDFRVLDICVMNNGYADGCTKAMLYMSTLYEAVRATTASNEFVLHNNTLKVTPPLNNVLLRKILVRIETGLRDY